MCMTSLLYQEDTSVPRLRQIYFVPSAYCELRNHSNILCVVLNCKSEGENPVHNTIKEATTSSRCGKDEMIVSWHRERIEWKRSHLVDAERFIELAFNYIWIGTMYLVNEMTRAMSINLKWDIWNETYDKMIMNIISDAMHPQFAHCIAVKSRYKWKFTSAEARLRHDTRTTIEMQCNWVVRIRVRADGGA